MAYEDLFADFSPATPEAWKEKVLKDLKGKPWEKLMWQTYEGFSLAPFYQKNDTNYTQDGVDSMPGEYPYRRGNQFQAAGEGWQVVEWLDTQQANWSERLAEAKAAGLHAVAIPQANDAEIWDHISWQDTALHLGTELNPAMVSLDMYTAMKSQGVKAELLTGTLTNDPISFFAAQGTAMPLEEFPRVEAGVLNFKQSPWFRGIGLDIGYVHEQGGTATQELAFALGTLVDYLDLLEQTESEITIEQVLANIALTFSVGTSFFMEVAKFRAFRMLYAQVVKAFGITDAALQSPFILARTGQYHLTQYDAYNNLLRHTTEALSAVVGGAQAVIVQPFDVLSGTTNGQSHRLARNIQHLLIHEAYMDKVIDPAGGSYYVEQLTQQLGQAAWELFQEIETGGGFLAKVAEGVIGEWICTAGGRKNDDFVTGKLPLIGVNTSPNLEETQAEPLAYAGHLSAGLERFRSQVDELGRKRGKRLRAGLWLFGDARMAQARAGFSRNILGSGGFEVAEARKFGDWEGMVPDHIVLCSSDEDYEAQAADQIAQLKAHFPEAKLFIAGKPAGWEDGSLAGALYRGMNLRDFFLALVPELKE